MNIFVNFKSLLFSESCLAKKDRQDRKVSVSSLNEISHQILVKDIQTAQQQNSGYSKKEIFSTLKNVKKVFSEPELSLSNLHV